MPANTKYLTQSPWIKLGKLSACILGCLVTTLSIFIALATWFDRTAVMGTFMYSSFMVWTGLMLAVYWLPKVWQVWGLLLLLTGVSIVATYLGLSS